jgi:hypothetical protein
MFSCKVHYSVYKGQTLGHVIGSEVNWAVNVSMHFSKYNICCAIHTQQLEYLPSDEWAANISRYHSVGDESRWQSREQRQQLR